MRTFKLLTGLGALALVTACQHKPAMDDSLKSDLALAASDQGLNLASSVNANKGQQVVSPVEQVNRTPPAPHYSARTTQPKHKPKAPPEPAPAPAKVAAEPTQTAPVVTPEPKPEPAAEKPAEGPPAPRPQPV